MRRRTSSAVPGRTGAQRGPVAVGLVVALAACGCQTPGGHGRSPEQVQLERRALDLLLRAAQSEDSVLCCHALEALGKVAPDEGLPYFHAALRSPAPLIRFAGLVAVGTLRDRAALSTATTLASDPHPLVRLAAAFALARGGDPLQVQALFRALNDDPEEKVRHEAAHLIGLLEEPRAVKRLRGALRVRANERSNVVRLEILSALARLGDEEGKRRLLEYAQGDALSRLLALQSLAELGFPESRDVLSYHLNAQEDYLLHRLIAARGLARLGSDAGYGLALKSTRYSGVDPGDPDDAYRVRFNALLVLGEIGQPRALPVLKQVAESDADPRLQAAACYGICYILRR